MWTAEEQPKSWVGTGPAVKKKKSAQAPRKNQGKKKIAKPTLNLKGAKGYDAGPTIYCSCKNG